VKSELHIFHLLTSSLIHSSLGSHLRLPVRRPAHSLITSDFADWTEGNIVDADLEPVRRVWLQLLSKRMGLALAEARTEENQSWKLF
jgi:hypothetical protein